MSSQVVPRRSRTRQIEYVSHELLPQATRFAMLVDPNTPGAVSSIKAVQAAASAIGRRIEVFNAGTNREIDTAFASLVQMRAEGVLVDGSQFFGRQGDLQTLGSFALGRCRKSGQIGNTAGTMSRHLVLCSMGRFYFHVRTDALVTDRRGRRFESRGQACDHAIERTPALLKKCRQPINTHVSTQIPDPFHPHEQR